MLCRDAERNKEGHRQEHSRTRGDHGVVPRQLSVSASCDALSLGSLSAGAGPRKQSAALGQLLDAPPQHLHLPPDAAQLAAASRAPAARALAACKPLAKHWLQ